MQAKATILEANEAPCGTTCSGDLVRLLLGRVMSKPGGKRVRVQVSWPSADVEFPVEILAPATGSQGLRRANQDPRLSGSRRCHPNSRV